jgi:hypothetical protein
LLKASRGAELARLVDQLSLLAEARAVTPEPVG